MPGGDYPDPVGAARQLVPFAGGCAGIHYLLLRAGRINSRVKVQPLRHKKKEVIRYAFEDEYEYDKIQELLIEDSITTVWGSPGRI